MKLLFALVLFVITALPSNATTIAWDGHMLAADSQTTSSMHKWLTKQKITDCGDYYVGAAGVCEINDQFIADFLKDGFEAALEKMKESELRKSLEDGDGCSLLVVEKVTGKVTLVQITKDFVNRRNNVPAPYAVGSGNDAAWGAMIAGKNAAEAVECAKQVDLYTGGPVKSVTIKK
jgi:hypothetical protein